MVISYSSLFSIGNAQADAVEIGTINNPIPVRGRVIELDVVTVITNVSNNFSYVVNVLYFYISFLIYAFYL